jgi:hypothetical protein
MRERRREIRKEKEREKRGGGTIGRAAVCEVPVANQIFPQLSQWA